MTEMLYTDLMVDLETLGTKPETGVPLLSIGWCVWHSHHEFPAEPRAAQIFVKESPGQADPSTLDWWMSQGARYDAIQKQCAAGFSLQNAVAAFVDAYRVNASMRVWSHGATFDVVILEYWLRHFQIDVPWKFWDVRDTRTLFDLGKLRFKGNTHDAREDAIAQARAVHGLWRRLKDQVA